MSSGAPSERSTKSRYSLRTITKTNSTKFEIAGHAATSRAFHRDLRDETVEVAIDRGHGADFPALAIPNHAVASVNVALDVESVPIAGMSDVIDRDVVVLAPEEGHAVIAIAGAEHGAGSGLSLPL